MTNLVFLIVVGKFPCAAAVAQSCSTSSTFFGYCNQHLTTHCSVYECDGCGSFEKANASHLTFQSRRINSKPDMGVPMSRCVVCVCVNMCQPETAEGKPRHFEHLRADLICPLVGTWLPNQC